METKTHVCPAWVGKLMISPLRKLIHSPEKMLSDYIRSGMNILEIGPGMGYFTLPLARITGEKGTVYAVDIQQNMLRTLKLRAEKADLGDRIITRTCTADSFNIADLENRVDFCLLFAVVHEVGNQEILFEQVFQTLKPGGSVYLAEPRGHVSYQNWSKSLEIAQEKGLIPITDPSVKRCFGKILIKKLK